MRMIAVLTVIVSISIPVIASRRPSQLSVEERLSLRFDAKASDERARAFAGMSRRPVTVSFVIQGHRNPEVLLPHELMDQLLLAAFAHQDERRGLIRETYEDGVRAISAEPAMFWSDLDQAGREYEVAHSAVVMEKRLDRANAQQPQLTQAAVSLCRARANALRFMRDRYPRFDEFLYDTVAPRMQVVSSVQTDAATLRRLEGGCK